MAKKTFSRYIWLIEILEDNDSGLTLKEIKEHWLKSTLNPQGNPLPDRTFLNHVRAIKEVFGINIAYVRKRFYVKHATGSTIGTWQITGDRDAAISVRLNKELQEINYYHDLFEHRILREYVPVRENVNPWIRLISKAMSKGVQIIITWQDYDSETEEIKVSPYALKEFKGYWYLLAYLESLKTFRIFALDERVADLELSEEPFDFYVYREELVRSRKRKVPRIIKVKEEKEPRWKNFNYCYGVAFGELEEIKIKTFGKEYYYWISDKCPFEPPRYRYRDEEGDGYRIIHFKENPDNPALISEILSRGEAIEVISPQSLVNNIRNHIENMAKRYTNEHII